MALVAVQMDLEKVNRTHDLMAQAGQFQINGATAQKGQRELTASKNATCLTTT